MFPSWLLAVPEEIVLNILKECDHRAILACKSTCRRIYDIISRSISIRYMLELAANGMQDSPCTFLGKVQCLDMLAAHETAWRTLSWSDNTPVEIPDGWGEPVSVSGNVIVFPNPDVPLRELLILRTPSKLRDVTLKSWRLQLVRDVRDVCIDSAQNLLICYRGVKSFHVCSLLTGESHPLAQHVAVIEPTSSWRYRIGSMRICGDNFAVASEQGLYISVWNWKSGKHISDFVRSLTRTKRSPTYLITNQFSSLQSSVFTFLDEYHILFPRSMDDSLYVYDVRAMPPINMKKPKLKGTHCFEITTPPLRILLAGCSIDLACNSVATGTDAAARIFFTDCHDRIVSLRVTAWPNSSATRAIIEQDYAYHEIHVRARSLLTWTQTHPAPPNACVTIPWSMWSPAAARVVAPYEEDGNVLYTCPFQSRFPGCGMRIVSALLVRSNGTSGVTVTDYHPARVFRSRKQGTSPNYTYTPTNAGTAQGQKSVASSSECGNEGAQDAVYSRGRSRSLPLLTVLKTPSIHAVSAMELIKNLFLRLYPSSQELGNAHTCHSRAAANKLQYLEKEMPLPIELWPNDSKPVFNVLCEDAVMFYTLVPGSKRIQYAHWYIF
ncbi:hypothetical protein F5148DRAFT_7683 [Russula earlei]|uniref:Uncharacterized protein n=1 Tax=Russula earlei TaxID=71964 RepID=A0ACC0UPE3_9AGAM|nr:hypothetical protein F5148DRAFT_7683 [Russula earlei]